MDLFQSMRVSMTGLSSQRIKINVISENLANSETTRTENGLPYRRKMVVLESKPVEEFDKTLSRSIDGQEGVAVAEIVLSPEAFKSVYNPSHPDADPETGYVAMPNVNVLTEMADLMTARRSYDANVTAMSNTKSMMLKALEIGK